MNLKITQPKVDGVTPEEIRKMVESPAFLVVVKRMKDQLARATHTCVFSGEQLEVMRAQGAAMALETAIQIPDRLLIEMKLG